MQSVKYSKSDFLRDAKTQIDSTNAIDATMKQALANLADQVVNSTNTLAGNDRTHLKGRFKDTHRNRFFSAEEQQAAIAQCLSEQYMPKIRDEFLPVFQNEIQEEMKSFTEYYTKQQDFIAQEGKNVPDDSDGTIQKEGLQRHRAVINDAINDLRNAIVNLLKGADADLKRKGIGQGLSCVNMNTKNAIVRTITPLIVDSKTDYAEVNKIFPRQQQTQASGSQS